VNNSPGAEIEGLDDAAAGQAVQTVEDFVLLKLEFLPEHGVVDLDEQDAAADDALRGAAVGGMLADEFAPVFRDEVLDFVLSDFIFLFEYLDQVAKGKGRAQLGHAAVLGQATQRGDQVVGLAGVFHGKRAG